MTSRQLTTDFPGEWELFESSRTSYYKLVIFPLLLKSGFTCTNITYRYGNTVVGTEDDVQKWLCERGIPRNIPRPDYEIIARWAAYAHVIPSAFKSGFREYTEKDIVEVLEQKLQLKREGKKSKLFVNAFVSPTMLVNITLHFA